ncbi:MAG TPA: histidine phosphatase family protein [Anaerolineae bacterium]
MKALTLIRHAKSSWDDTSLADKLRPLNERGLRDAPLIGRRLAEHGAKPDLMMASPALRALTTAQLIADEVGYPRGDIKLDDRLYEALADGLLAVIRGLDDHWQQVFMVCHNPAVADLASRLTSGKISQMPTCSIVTLTYELPAWSGVGDTEPTDVRFDSPKGEKLTN